MSQENNRPLKSALFVDFDNIYLGLQQLDEVAAERFGIDPASWLNWLMQGMPGLNNGQQTPQPKREILIRRCYLNPRDFHRYRPYFIRSAFSVIDCPSLTSQGKNSADIYMVMDIIDTLEHKTHFDEFIIFSGDADFTPVLLRLRAHGRKTAVLAAGPASPAYIAASDLVISEDVFIEHALVTGEVRRGLRKGDKPLVITATPQLLEAMAEKLYAEASANGEILATDLPRIYREFPEFRRDSNWLGFFSLRALTTDLTRRHPDLHITEGDPWRVTVQVPKKTRRAVGRRAPERPADISEEERLRGQILSLVRKMVAEADEPILMAKAAHEVTNKLGERVLASRWAGAGTFKNLLLSEEGLEFEIATTPSPGYLYDPERHELPAAEHAADEEEVAPELATFAERVSQITGTPNLTPRQYALLFTAIAEDLKEAPYNLTNTSKSVRDRCIEQGETISRANVSFVLKGMTYAKHRFSKRDTPRSLARVYRNSVLARCQDAELELTSEEKKLLDAWLMGGLRQNG
ncbi:MAG: NYN domain-containing protein [Caldilineae bacterium]|nr:MAG: NYN domain-containing protein [Caldilineae bacterium]